jgi:hypothetical protein
LSTTLRILLLLLLTAACGHLPVQSSGAIPPAPLQLLPEEQEVLSLLELAAQVSASEKVWPGFQTQDLPLLVYCSGPRALALGPYPGAAPLPSYPSLGPVALVPRTQLPLKDVGSLFLSDLRLHGVGWFVMRHQAGDDPVDWYRTLVHELFHVYQKTAFVPGPRPACRYPYEDCANFTALAAEGQLLADLLDADQQCSPGLADYAASRLGRLGGASGAVAASIEDQEERLEGTARYVEVGYALEADLTTARAESVRARDALADPQPSKLQKWRYYESGRALLRLAKGSVAGWVEAGDAPFRVMLRSCKLAPPPAPPLANKSLCEARIGAYLERESSLLVAYEQATGTRLRLWLPRSTSSFYSNQGMTFATTDCRLFISGLQLFEDRQASLVVRKRPVFLQARRDDGLYYLEFKGKLLQLTVDGQTLALEGLVDQAFGKSVGLNGEGFSLDFQGKGRISLKDGTLALEAAPQSPKGAE